MSTWRRKSIEILPENSHELSLPETTIYTVMREMRHALANRHSQGDKEGCKAIFDYVAWCFQRREKDLWNAAGVSFYEHLDGIPALLNELDKWIPSSIYRQIRDLLVMRIDKEKMKELDGKYQL